ncbi:MAG: protein kinase [Acidobacteria bacterium]|nr:protein kinase [Acidobacteriota bacterium]
MDPDRWRTVKEVFEKALEAEESTRSAVLDRACAGDAMLRQEVESLLASHLQAPDFIEKPAVVFNLADKPAEKRFGPYLVLRKIGQGGMGSVYLGVRDDEQFNKRVAIKVVHFGDTEEILRRFRHERQILATLDHPNIAKLLDGGTTEDGLPYFVMDYVEGTSLLEYCDAQRLSLAERLRIFVTICSAVQYIHQNLVIHRDLKPGNIIVTAEGTPKLLDFGIAKLLKPELLTAPQDATRIELQMMTAGYASPEQVRGDPITTASDVYSLGVILFELLSGHRPYLLRNDSPAEITRVVCEQEAERPSATVSRVEEVSSDRKAVTTTPHTISRNRSTTPEKLERDLRGDLDSIVLKALRKEPVRRYPSAGQFAEDVERYLAGLPVNAHQGSLQYLAGKFVRRNYKGVIAAGLVTLSLVGGMIATTWQARVARQERSRAERRFNDVRYLANSFLFEFHDSIQNLPGSTPARRLVVRKALEYLDSLSKESAADSGLRIELAQAYQKVGDVQGNPANPNLGDTSAAQASYRRSLQILEDLAYRDPKNSKARLAMANAFQVLADTQSFTGDLQGAADQSRKSIALFQQLVNDGGDSEIQRRLAAAYLKTGDILGSPNMPSLGDRRAAFENYQKAEQIAAGLLASNPSDPAIRRTSMAISDRMGILLETEGKYRESEARYATALQISRDLALQFKNSTRETRSLAAAHARMAKILSLQSSFKLALDHYRQALDLLEPLAASDPSNANASRSLASVTGMMGQCLDRSGDHPGALRAFRKALDIIQNLAKRDPKNTTLQKDIAAYQELIAGPRNQNR